METNIAAVKMRNITKSFGPVLANDRVWLNIYKGEILALLGENGSGKTTLMNMLSGIYFPDEGDIYINDEKVVIRSPKDIVNICAERNDVTIREIMARDAMQEQSHVVTQDDSIYYFIQVDESHQAIPGQGARRIILSATTFCYSTVQQ